MHVGEIGNEEVLVTADDSGHISVHFPHNPSRPALNMKLPLSAWGIDTHSSRRLLVVSCNAHIVTIYHLGMGIEEWQWTTTCGTTLAAPIEVCSQAEDEDASRRLTAAVRAAEGSFPSLTMFGHKNNIPCVAFDRTGNYVVSGSLDRTMKMWECGGGQCLWNLDTTEYVPSTGPLFNYLLRYFNTVFRFCVLFAIFAH